MPEPTPLDDVFQYHERTKHHFHRYARSLGYLDWETQPDPFRTYPGAPAVRMTRPTDDRTPPYDRIFQPASIPSRPLTQQSLSDFLYYSLALSAWKSFRNSRWALRVNPSSGNLHPTEAYLLLPAVAGFHADAALFHYLSRDHALERRAEFGGGVLPALLPTLPPDAFLIGLSSIHWRESWKYGERAFRYCQHDAGHALAAVRIAAAGLGWSIAPIEEATDDEIAALLGLDRAKEFHAGEREEPDLLAVVMRGHEPFDTRAWNGAGARKLAAEATWHGAANPLSKDHHDWEVIDRVSAACRRNAPAPREPVTIPAQTPDSPARRHSLGAIVRGRRSAVSLDGTTSLPRKAFYALLRRVVPALCPVPWDAWPWPPSIHLGLFVHRVDGLAPGLYALARDSAAVPALRTAMDAGFGWTAPPARPAGLDLHLLREGDVRTLAARVSCEQDIAGNGAFSLGMIADFEEPLRRRGAWYYRRLFWETGMIGQVLYLEAEAAGVRGTGIGCFFDDPVHEAFGLKGRGLQSLYHFTIGGPVEDDRLTTEPAYPAI